MEGRYFFNFDSSKYTNFAIRMNMQAETKEGWLLLKNFRCTEGKIFLARKNFLFDQLFTTFEFILDESRLV